MSNLSVDELGLTGQVGNTTYIGHNSGTYLLIIR
jgi:hypothetical protein